MPRLKGDKKALAKWRKTMMEKYGGKEGMREYFAKIGQKGGQNSHTGGFASYKVGADGLTGREREKLVGAIGGLTPKRGPKWEE